VDQIIIVKSKEIETLIKRIKGRDKRSYSETLAIVTFQNEYINRNYYDNRELDDQIRHKLTVVYNEDGMLEKTFATSRQVHKITTDGLECYSQLRAIFITVGTRDTFATRLNPHNKSDTWNCLQISLDRS
jgi:hypothetical protein